MKRIGERIKKYRRIYNMALGDLATKVGITPSALSQIENAKAYPSIITLKSIAKQLHTTVGELIGENEGLSHSPISRFSAYNSIKIHDCEATIYQIPNEDSNKQMDSFVVILNQNEKIEDLFASHSGQRMCYLMKGNTHITIDEKTYELREGDSAFFNAKNKHTIKNRQTEKAELLIVIAPANA
ncbi:MAG: helix-turn-helix transcriptional regulator [Paludibacteraceae bacterium]|nr:helix-turn-helix transcriptional regulator [Paludibacteraceae bacterium]MBP6285212.1 helix-turn-helix transcriptional regulator [Paludibacteraceae bacterium]